MKDKKKNKKLKNHNECQFNEKGICIYCGKYKWERKIHSN